MSRKILTLALSVVGALVLTASALAVTTTDVTNDARFAGPPGQASCASFSSTATEVARFSKASDNSPFPSSLTNGPVTLSNVTNQQTFDFTSTVTIAYVLIHTGGQLTLYNYAPTGTTSGTGLGGLNGNGLSGATFCTDSGVLAVNLRSFSATPSAKGATLRWRTASEIDVAGYNVYGLVHGNRVKLNSRIIASKSVGANSYAYQYRTIKGQKAPSRFWLQSINLDGSRQWHAARSVR